MPHSNWKGFISFGLVSIPIVLYTAENKSADISFHQIDKRDKSRIKYQRINENTGKVVPWEDISRGYEYESGVTIPVPNDVLEKVAGDNSKTINILTFINKNELDLITISKSYYLIPEKKGTGIKGYNILRDALVDMNKIGIAKVIISTKEYISAIMPYEDVLVMCLLKYDSEMRKLSDFEFPNKKEMSYKINKTEMDMAKQLIKTMSTKWRPEKYKDEYQGAIHQWVHEAVKKLPHTIQKKHVSHSKNVVNFVDLLKKSLSANSKTFSNKKNPAKKKKLSHRKR